MTNEHIELPAPYQREVYATAENTPAVRKGFEMGGYVKSPDLWTREQIEDAISAHEQARVVSEPVAYWIPKAEQFCLADPKGRPFAKAWEPLFASPPAPQEAQAALPNGWVPCELSFDGGEPEEVAYGPPIMMDRLGRWLTNYFASRLAALRASSPADMRNAPLYDPADAAFQKRPPYCGSGHCSCIECHFPVTKERT